MALYRLKTHLQILREHGNWSEEKVKAFETFCRQKGLVRNVEGREQIADPHMWHSKFERGYDNR